MDAIRGNVAQYMVVGLLLVVAYLVIKNGRDIKRLNESLMLPAPAPDNSGQSSEENQ